MKQLLPTSTFLLVLGSLSLTTLSAVGQQAGAISLYVNDAATTGDTFTQAAGSDVTGNGTAAAPFATVTRALQAAGTATTTIFIDAGTYAERIVLSKTISLRGAGTATGQPGSATIFDAGIAQAGDRSHEVAILLTAPGGTVAAPLRIANLTIRAYDLGLETDGRQRSNVTLEDVEILDQRQYGVFWNSLGGAENLTFRRVHIARTAVDPANVRTNYNGSSSPAGRGLFIVNGTKQNILIEGGSYEKNRRSGIDINDGSVSGLVIRGARFSQNGGAALAILGAGGQRDANGSFVTAAALLERNTIENNGSNGMELKSATGNGLASGAGSFVVRENIITRLTTRPDGLSEDIPTALTEDNAGIAFIDRDRNVIKAGGGVTGDLVTGGAYLANNTIEGYIASEAQSNLSSGINGFGLVVEGSRNQVLGNTINQCQIGVQVQERPTNSTSAAGQITPFFDISRNSSLPATDILIQDNRLDNCTQALVAVGLSTPLAAPLNWFGSTAAAALYGPGNQNGLVATISRTGTTFTRESPVGSAGRIDFSPFLHSNTDADEAVGFQGDRTYLHVDAGSPTTGSVAALQKGIDLLPEDGTLSTAAGTYNEELIITKAFTLQNTGPTTLRDLTLNAPDKVLTLGSPLMVAGKLTLTSGRVLTSSTNLLSLTATATASAGNATAYVDGPLRKIGAQPFVFPVGKNGQWARIGISAPTSSATGFTAEYCARRSASTTNGAVLTAPLHNISTIDHWCLAQDGDTPEAVRVRLFWENAFRSGIDAFTEDLQVARYDGSAWVTAGNSNLGGKLDAGSVQSEEAVSFFGTFTLGSLSASVNPLTTELTALRAAESTPGTVQLDWATQQTVTPQGFDVERSYDQQTWQKVGYVAGSASTAQRAYRYQDHPERANVTAAYRLRQVLASGARVSSSAEVQLTAVTLPTKSPMVASGLALYPNPTTSQVQIQLPTASTGTVDVTVCDLTGRTVLTRTLPTRAGTTQPLPLPADLQTGVYLVRLHGQGFADSVVRLVKQ